jgi:trk system potassium uptake protein TrkA
LTTFIVVGLGNFGATAAVALAELGWDVSAVDSDSARVDPLTSILRRVLVGDGTEPEVLELAGARDAQVGIVSMGDDVTASILTAVTLRDLGVREIHVKVVSSLHARILSTIGVATSIFPERESAERLAKRIVNRAILDYIELGPDLSLQEIAAPRPWVGRTLRELSLPQRYGVSVVAVRDYLTGAVTTVPDPDRRFTESDSLILAGEEEKLTRVAKLTS